MNEEENYSFIMERICGKLIRWKANLLSPADIFHLSSSSYPSPSLSNWTSSLPETKLKSNVSRIRLESLFTACQEKIAFLMKSKG
ncbi:hypothetical protein ES288_A04G101400v1 [Gossypium darwinii]|uniref:Uncharacterized protein n=1 Tax=Gossypium darwinii TaxID=34276 RepID=A0A5D2GVB5_GOSDA|nr:hypothetical protein ES288_A04G101400v1 [Gossypium darwinii]